MATRIRERPLLILATLMLLPFVAIAGWNFYTRPLAFDSPRWRSGDGIVRYRMRDALRAKYDAGDLATLDAVDKALGPGDDSSDPSRIRYYRLKSPGLGFPWYVHVNFDETGKVFRFIVAPS